MSAPPLPDSRYLDFLPAIFRDGAGAGLPALNPILRAVEALLSGAGDPARPGLAEIIGGIAGEDAAGPSAAGGARLAGLHRYYEPGPGLSASPGLRAPVAFLDWLAGWVALSLRADLDEEAQREFIARAVSLYRIRGTPEGLRQVLEIHTRLGATIDEGGPGMRVGVVGQVGVDTILGGFVPNYFEVTLRRGAVPTDAAAGESVPEAVARYGRIATAIIEAEKPAHCTYRLLPFVPVAFQVGTMSRVGVDTLIGPANGPRPASKNGAKP